MLDIETLIFPVMLMMGVAFLYSMILRTLRDRPAAAVATGVLFGAAIVLAMSIPIRLPEGLIFDLRGLFVGLAMMFGGWLAALIAVTAGLIYRVIVGGDGMLAGCLGLVLAFGLGAVWRAVSPRIKLPALIRDALFGAVMSCTLVTLLVLPRDLAAAILGHVGLPFVIANVLGAVCLGFVLRREAKFVHDSEELRVYAAMDPLTKLLNRRGAEEALRNLNDRTERGRALFYFDVDRFKAINDTYGHAAGDAALAAVADRIRGVVREDVIFSRHGGDEFTLFITDVNEQTVAMIANRMRRCVADVPVAYGGQDIPVSISVGVYWTERLASFDEMLHHADAALLRAKAMGRNRVSLATLTAVPETTRLADWPAATGAVH